MPLHSFFLNSCPSEFDQAKLQCSPLLPGWYSIPVFPFMLILVDGRTSFCVAYDRCKLVCFPWIIHLIQPRPFSCRRERCFTRLKDHPGVACCLRIGLRPQYACQKQIRTAQHKNTIWLSQEILLIISPSTVHPWKDMPGKNVRQNNAQQKKMEKLKYFLLQLQMCRCVLSSCWNEFSILRIFHFLKWKINFSI